MKHLSDYHYLKVIILLLILTCSSQIFGQCPAVVWADEFDGSSLDLTKWNYQIGDGCAEGICGWGNNELQSYQEGNVTVSNGTLKITAKKERVKGSSYTSGRINSKNKGDFTYGRFEASIKLPYGDGLWPAFWMLSTDEPYGGWPQSGEIDIMEFTAADPTKIYGTIHYGDPYPNNQHQGNSYYIDKGAFPDNFHEFAIEWEPGEIRWFIDGLLYSTKTIDDVSPYQWPFDHDFHFLLNVAVGGTLGGPVDDQMLPASMEVDYVRVYDGFKPYLAGKTVALNQEQGLTFRLGNVGANTSVNWSVPSDAVIVSGQGSAEITVDFGHESGYVTAVYEDACASGSLSMPIEVEPPFRKSFSFEDFDGESNLTFKSTTGTLNVVDNPAPNMVNGSARSAAYTRNSGERYDVLVYNLSAIQDASEYVTKEKKFLVDIYTDAPIGTEIILQLETPTATASNYPTGRHSRYVATISENNNWHRLIFTLLDKPDPEAADTDVNTLILLFAPNSNNGDTYYFDNLDNYIIDQEAPGSNQSPEVSITSPADGAVYTTGENIVITATASDSDGSVAEVTFMADEVNLGTVFSPPYEINWTVADGTTTLKAIATDNEGAKTTSTGIGVTGKSGSESPTAIYVSSITTGTKSAGKGAKHGTATVLILDDQQNPIQGASVTGTFSGTFKEQLTADTDASGTAHFQTSNSSKGSLSIGFCVNDVVYSQFPYDPALNTITCTSGTSASRYGDKNEPRPFVALNEIYPNPVKDFLNVSLGKEWQTATLSIYDLQGKEVLKADIKQAENIINVSKLQPGVYMIKIIDQDNQTYTNRIVK